MLENNRSYVTDTPNLSIQWWRSVCKWPFITCHSEPVHTTRTQFQTTAPQITRTRCGTVIMAPESSCGHRQSSAVFLALLHVSPTCLIEFPMECGPQCARIDSNVASWICFCSAVLHFFHNHFASLLWNYDTLAARTHGPPFSFSHTLFFAFWQIAWVQTQFSLS